MMFRIYLCLCVFVFCNSISAYHVVLSGDGDVIQGQTAQFKVEVFEETGVLSTAEFSFVWSDNTDPQHTASFVTKSPATWNVTYDSRFPPEVYQVTVKVYKYYLFIWTQIGSATQKFDVTSFLTGDVVLSQGNYTRKKYVSNLVPVHHEVVLQKPYIDFLNKTKNFMRTFWFVDCLYYGQDNGFQFDFNYTKVETVHYVEALLMATYVPDLSKKQTVITEKPITTNTTAPQINGTTTAVTPLPNTYTTTTNKTIDFGYTDEAFQKWLTNHIENSKLSNLSRSSGYCINSTVLPISNNYTYGFFRANFTVKAPVKVSPINGTNWLMDGEVLNISVSCNGSSPYSFCVLLKSGLYNITGNETCKEEKTIRNCSFGIQHLFKEPSEYTLVVIISNAVSRVVKPIAVNIYKVKKHAQLSVIIVPVSFSLIATILIIFGVAYYVQSKHKYTIEVADFDFGNQTSNMEYKTFRERLRESISNSFLKNHDYQDSDSSWSESAPTSRKYGSMQ